MDWNDGSYEDALRKMSKQEHDNLYYGTWNIEEEHKFTSDKLKTAMGYLRPIGKSEFFVNAADVETLKAHEFTPQSTSIGTLHGVEIRTSPLVPKGQVWQHTEMPANKVELKFPEIAPIWGMHARRWDFGLERFLHGKPVNPNWTIYDSWRDGDNWKQLWPYMLLMKVIRFLLRKDR